MCGVDWTAIGVVIAGVGTTAAAIGVAVVNVVRALKDNTVATQASTAAHVALAANGEAGDPKVAQ